MYHLTFQVCFCSILCTLDIIMKLIGKAFRLHLHKKKTRYAMYDFDLNQADTYSESIVVHVIYEVSYLKGIQYGF